MSKMAEVAFFRDSSGERSIEGLFSALEDYESDNSNTFAVDDGLSPLQRLENYIESENLFSRQMAARSLLETLQQVSGSVEDTETVFHLMDHVASDREGAVRAELVEHIPQLAAFCQESNTVPFHIVKSHIVPILTRALSDVRNQVRKTAQTALNALQEQKFLDAADLEIHVCPILLDQTSLSSTDDVRTEAINMICKLAPIVGRDATVRLLLARFAELCSDNLLHVRKVCATHFGEVCSVVGAEYTESHLVERFCALCEDVIWGVRKVCAECFMQVSQHCSPDVRTNRLSPLFVSLLGDQSRWVRMAAFQALGGFISTFANPDVTGLSLDSEGALVYSNVAQLSGHAGCNSQSTESCSCGQDGLSACSRLLDSKGSCSSNRSQLPSDSEAFSSFRYWQQPVLVNVPDLVAASTAETNGADMGKTTSVVAASVTEEVTRPVLQDPPAEPSESIPGHDLPVSSDDNSSSSSSSSSDSSVVPQETVTSSSDAVDTSSSDSDSSNSRPPIEVDVNIVEAKDNSGASSNINGDSVTASEENLTAAEGGGEARHDNRPLGARRMMERRQQLRMANTVSASDGGLPAVEVATNISSTQVIGECLAGGGGTLMLVSGVLRDSRTYNNASEAVTPPIGAGDTSVPSLSPLMSSWKQDLVPQQLLEYYCSMVDPGKVQTVDPEITRHCAYNLPAVAFTLGRHNWPCISDLYEAMTSDMQWKVRRALAFSIHEVAAIVGEEVTRKQLVPIFNNFLKDLDEVRTGVLKHLADFLQLLAPDLRQQYLGRLQEFLVMENARNWRFREELATQLVRLVGLYSVTDVHERLLPLAMTLVNDCVAQVRFVGFRVLSAIIRVFSLTGRSDLCRLLAERLVRQFAEDERWSRRQMYAQTLACIIEDASLPAESFASLFLTALLALCSDPVPNVRISVARLFATYGAFTRQLQTGGDGEREAQVEAALKKLEHDSDSNVREFFAPSWSAGIGDAVGATSYESAAFTPAIPADSDEA